MRTFEGTAELRSPSNTPVGGSTGRTIGQSGSVLYCRPPAKSSKSRRLSTGCGWYEYGLYDVAIALTEVPLRSYEVEYRERTIFSPHEPPPIEIPTKRPQPIVLKVRTKPKACAPPHPSTVRVCYEPDAMPLAPPETSEPQHQNSGKKFEKNEKTTKPQEKPERQNTIDAPGKEEKRREKLDRVEKPEKSDKLEKHTKEKHEKHEKEKKKNTRDSNAEGGGKEEA